VPPELRDRAAAWLKARRAEGRTVAELAAELGLAPGTVLRWSNKVVTAIVPVRVVADAATAERVAVVTPSGFRIEGVTLEDAVRVLRELG
jgi:transcriptional regulator with XRE-family HTH domain